MGDFPIHKEFSSVIADQKIQRLKKYIRHIIAKDGVENSERTITVWRNRIRDQVFKEFIDSENSMDLLKTALHELIEEGDIVIVNKQKDTMFYAAKPRVAVQSN